MRIAHVITRLIPGGASQVVRDIIRHNHNAGEQFLFVGPDDLPANYCELVDLPPSQIHVVPKMVRHISPWQDWQACWQLRRKFRQGDFDVIHTHTSKAGIVGRISALGLRKPVVVHTPHGHIYLDNSAIDGVPQNRTLLAVLLRAERLAGGGTDALVALSEDERRFSLEQRLARHCEVIPNGVDLARYARDDAGRRSVRNELGIDDDHFVVVTVGRINPVKGTRFVLEALQALQQQGKKQIRLLLVGTGIDDQALQDEFAELIRNQLAFFVGSKANVTPYLSAGDCFVLPSLYEGFGIAVIEALACRLPVVASDVGGVPYIVEDGRNGVLVPPGDALAIAEAVSRLAGDAALCERLAAAGLETSSAYSAERMADQYRQLYERLIHARSES